MSRPVVLLIPGIFGFNAFGRADKPILEYFAGVEKILRGPPWKFTVLVHEPPPTGSLVERATSLYEALGKIKRGERLPHAAEAVQADRVFLIGHSTGGLDARHVVNPAFRLANKPTSAERKEIIAMVEEIVTISAPFWGSPVVSCKIVRYLDSALLVGVQLLTMLGICRQGWLDSLVLQVVRADFAAMFQKGLTSRARLKTFIASTARREAERRGYSEPETTLVAEQVAKFVDQLEHDRGLYDDLTVGHMEELNAQIGEFDKTERITSYVTVSPKPPWIDLGLDELGRVVYGILYRATARGASERPQVVAKNPRPIGWAWRVARLLRGKAACDGAVPARSQTLNGTAQRVVLGDHLDVVGSYSGGPGADVMRSSSHMTKKRFEALWKDIAKHLHAAEQQPRRAMFGDGRLDTAS